MRRRSGAAADARAGGARQSRFDARKRRRGADLDRSMTGFRRDPNLRSASVARRESPHSHHPSHDRRGAMHKAPRSGDLGALGKRGRGLGSLRHGKPWTDDARTRRLATRPRTSSVFRPRPPSRCARRAARVAANIRCLARRVNPARAEPFVEQRLAERANRSSSSDAHPGTGTYEAPGIARGPSESDIVTLALSGPSLPPSRRSPPASGF